MFHRKLVSEEVAVLDPRIYHRGDGEKGGKKRSREVCRRAPALEVPAGFSRTHQRGSGSSGERWEERCAAEG